MQFAWAKLDFYVFIRMDHEGPGLDIVGNLLRPARRCRKPLSIALDGIFFLFCLGFFGNLPAYVDP